MVAASGSFFWACVVDRRKFWQVDWNAIQSSIITLNSMLLSGTLAESIYFNLSPSPSLRDTPSPLLNEFQERGRGWWVGGRFQSNFHQLTENTTKCFAVYCLSWIGCDLPQNLDECLNFSFVIFLTTFRYSLNCNTVICVFCPFTLFINFPLQW